ncbi:cob(I)yrinic acid a,c-diamide adenosyltransferase [Adlercreutzia faecimuris]|uniref:Corrinoid adenosyltransferase n=1 Tax=Adlercreutzia faecimuris TaxID=2897341 RepID=A0ABS9WFN7_9ACTN|nr:cob(I)yrinic acid a,c-diamide adenosyltransferase [Adlercreutzia sp. JBNU-10]MCI2241678.1 cob(I)yrinic acid a,c-diamide adenosyltransferase [Adlercreutzia sp. JBNU-10]
MQTTVTRTGDGGETSLLDGTRVPKASAPIEALGAVDEAQAALGMARALARNAAVREELRGAEVLLAELMGDIAAPGRDPRLGADAAAALEQAVARLAAPLPDRFGFVVPGDDVASAQLHVARTVVRRAEWALWRLRAAGEEGAVPLASDEAMACLNRISDLCHVCALIEAREA